MDPCTSETNKKHEDNQDEDIHGEENKHIEKTQGEYIANHSEILPKIIRFFAFQKEITVEPILFLYNIASQLAWITSQDLMILKACKVNFGYPDIVCNDLSNHENEEVAVQSMVSTYLMWRSILETAIKVALARFTNWMAELRCRCALIVREEGTLNKFMIKSIVSVPALGWWGDRWGRKGPLILSLVSLGLESTIFLVNSIASSWPLEAILLSSFFYGISGGVYGILLLAFSFMAEKSSTTKRTMRMGILDGFYYLGSPVGLALAPPLFKFIGYDGVFSVCVTIYAITVIYVIIRIAKGLSNRQAEVENRPTTCHSCGLDRLGEAFTTTIKPRPEKARRYILICIMAMLLDSFVIYGEADVKYLFTERALDWDYTKYSHYATISALLTVIGALVIVPAITLNTSVKDPLIGLAGAMSRVLERLFYSFATNPRRAWLMYAGSVAGIGSPMAPIAIRSQISKLAIEDVGQVYAVMAVGETLLPFASAPAYKNVYEASVDGYPGAFYVMSLGLNMTMGLCFLYVFLSMRNQRRST